jgi:hypothetical protein
MNDHQLCIQCKYKCKQWETANIFTCKFLRESPDARKMLAKIEKERRKK